MLLISAWASQVPVSRVSAMQFPLQRPRACSISASSWRMFRKDRLLERAFSQTEGRNGGDGRPMTTTAFLAQMRVHSVYGVLFQQRGPAGIQAAARALPIRWSAPLPCPLVFGVTVNHPAQASESLSKRIP